MRPIFLALVFLVLVTLPASAQTLESVCTETGTLSRESYISQVTGRDRSYTVYLPPCYDLHTSAYPLLMLLHGSNADDRQWARLGFFGALEEAVDTGAAPDMIVLMPYGGSVANQNQFHDKSYDAILLDFLEQMKERYRINGAQAVGGLSRGGFWAYHLGLQYAEEFVAVGGHSAFFDRDHVDSAYNPLDLVEALDSATKLKLWLDRGTDDYAADGVDQMHVKLKRAQVPHDYVVYADGRHSEASWIDFVEDYVAFYARAFAGEAAEASSVPTDEIGGVELWLPAVGFGALQTSIDSEDLDALLAGELDSRLALSESALARLQQFGFEFHPDVNIQPDERKLFNALWRDKASFTLLPIDKLHMRLRPLWVDDVPVVDQLDSYPLALVSEAPNFSAEKLTRITLSGTTAVARHTLPVVDVIGVEAAASGIRDYVRLSDYFQITHEASFAPTCPAYTDEVLGGNNSMCMKRDHGRLFEILDVDVIDLTGNHINDFGYQALLNTLDVFDEWGVELVGGGRTKEEARKPLILEHNGSRIGWLACNAIGPRYAFANDDPEAPYGRRPGAAFCDHRWLRDALPLLAAEVDLVLLTVQYREFEAFQPLQRQRSDFQTFAEWGADVVIGTAEHKPMTVEFYRTRRGEDAFIHYGLGNLFFDQLPWGNRRFFMDTLYIYEGRLLAVELFPGIIEDRARPRLLTGDDLFNFLHLMFIQKNGF